MSDKIKKPSIKEISNSFTDFEKTLTLIILLFLIRNKYYEFITGAMVGIILGAEIQYRLTKFQLSGTFAGMFIRFTK